MATLYAAAELTRGPWTLTASPDRDTIEAAGALTASSTFAGGGRVVVELNPWAVATGSTLGAHVAARGVELRAVVVELDGTQVAELERATIGAVSWELNEWETAQLALPIDDPKAALLLDPKFREVQIWRGDRLLVFGPVVGLSANLTTITAEVAGPLWHLSRRHLGRANRTSQIKNGDFARGLAWWQFLKTAHYLTFGPLRRGWDVSLFEPGRNGTGRALALRQDRRPWKTPEDRIDADTIYVEVLPGDTVHSLARTYYGSGSQGLRILAANWAEIEADARAAGLWRPRDPVDYLKPGRILAIPPVAASEAEAAGNYDLEWGAVVANQEIPVDGGPLGMLVTVSAWCQVVGREFDGWHSAHRGVVLGRYPENYRSDNLWTRDFGGWANTWGGLRGLYTEALEVTSSKLDDDHPVDIWTRHETSIFVPPNRSEVVVVQLEAADGLTVWDDVSVTLAEGYYRKALDQRTIVGDLIEHAQDPAYGKSGLNLGHVGKLTKVRRTLEAPYDEHPNIWDLITAITGPDDGVDISAEVTPTTRTARVHFPQLGARRGNIGLQLGRNLASFAWSFMGDTASSAVIVLGDGSGSDREEAAAIDPAGFAGGLTLEEVFRAPEGTAIEDLDRVAAERLAVVRHPETLALRTLTLGPGRHRDLFGRVWVGDIVPVVIERGVLTIEGDYRVVKLTLTADNRLDLVMNRWDR